MQTIIAPVDFSDTSINAAYYAADLSLALGAKLKLVHVFALPLPVSELPVSVSDADIKVSEADERIQLLREQLQESTGKQLIIEGEIKQGDVLTGIEEYCDKFQPLAVVMGAETMGPIERLVMGGKTIGAVSNLSFPVIVVPPDAYFTKWQKIALACDPGKSKSLPVQKIKMMAGAFKSQLQVLFVSEGKSLNTELYNAADWAWLPKEAGDASSAIQYIEDVNVERGLLNWISSNKPDLFILVPQNHSSLFRLFNGGHSQKMVLHSPIPLMTIHA